MQHLGRGDLHRGSETSPPIILAARHKLRSALQHLAYWRGADREYASAYSRVIRRLRHHYAQLISEPLQLNRVTRGTQRQIQVCMAVSDEGNDTHEPDQHLVTIHAGNPSVQSRYFAGKGLAADRVKRIGVLVGQFA